MKNFRFLLIAFMSTVCLLGFSSCSKDDGSLDDSGYSESSIYSKLSGEWSCGYQNTYNYDTYTLIFYSNGTYYRDLWINGSRNYWRVGDYEYADGYLFFYDSDDTTVSVIYKIEEFTDSTLILSVNNGSSTYEYNRVEE